MLFPSVGLGPWKEQKAYCCFLLAATVGMTRQELLALKWRHISFESKNVRIEDAWKGGDEEGLPKWGRSRTSPLPEFTKNALLALRQDSIRTAPDDLVFCYDDGSRLGETWWRKRFVRSMEAAKIDWNGRNLKPHSFRHSLNTYLLDRVSQNS
jgi:integrase